MLCRNWVSSILFNILRLQILCSATLEGIYSLIFLCAVCDRKQMYGVSCGVFLVGWEDGGGVHTTKIPSVVGCVRHKRLSSKCTILSVFLPFYAKLCCTPALLLCVFRLVFFLDGKGAEKAKDPPPPFSGDLFIRRVHLLVGEVLKTLWSDPRLPSLPHDAVSRVLAAVHEVMQSLQVCRENESSS